MPYKDGLEGLELLADQREAILSLSNKHGATNIRIFGSVARGEATPQSDIDFLVDWDYTRISAWGGVGLSLELEELLGRKIDLCTEATLHQRVKQRILQEAIPL